MQARTLQLKITYRKVEDLEPYAENARTHSDKQIQQIAASIRAARSGMLSDRTAQLGAWSILPATCRSRV